MFILVFFVPIMLTLLVIYGFYLEEKDFKEDNHGMMIF